MILKKGDKGPNVGVWQRFVGAAIDNDFGPGTETATKHFQTECGLTADGIVGDATIAAATAKGFQGFSALLVAPAHTPMPQLTDADYCAASVRLGCDPAAIAAVASQESLGVGFDPQGKPTILFERHLFHRLTGGRFDASHPNISNATPGGYGATAAQYGRFEQAFTLDPDAAMKSASWGKFQILGNNFAICGFASVGDFVAAMKVSETEQLKAFCAFILHNHLDQALIAHDWTRFANGYNGAAQKMHHYDSLIAAKFTAGRHHDFHCPPIAGAGPD